MHSDLLRIRLDPAVADSEFMTHQLHYSRDIEYQISMISQGAIMSGINVGKLKTIKVLLPPLRFQEEFRLLIHEIHSGMKMHQRALFNEEALFSSLQDRAFSGEI
jgi:type I restriction enzyme S subunit